MPTISRKDTSNKDQSVASSESQNSATSSQPKRSRKRRAIVSFGPNSKKTKTASARIARNKEQYAKLTDKITVNFSQDETSVDQDASQRMTTSQETVTPASSLSLRGSSSELSALSGSQFSSAASCLSFEDESNDLGRVQITDKHFIQQQVVLLSTPLTLHDCPQLLRLQDCKTGRKGHIPHDVIQDVLRKFNHKMDDELQKHLNRQFQRKVLDNLFDLEKAVNKQHDQQCEQEKSLLTEAMDTTEILTKCHKEWNADEMDIDESLKMRYTDILNELEQIDCEIKEIKQKISSHEMRDHFVSQVESLAKVTSQNVFQTELSRARNLVSQISDTLRRQTTSD